MHAQTCMSRHKQLLFELLESPVFIKCATDVQAKLDEWVLMEEFQLMEGFTKPLEVLGQ